MPDRCGVYNTRAHAREKAVTMSSTKKNKLTCATTRTGANFENDQLGIIVGVTTHGGAPVRVKPSFDGDGNVTRVSVIVDGKKHRDNDDGTVRVMHRYHAATPRHTDALYPKLTVNGKTKKNTSYEYGAFPAHGAAANTAARLIASVKLADPVLRMHDGTEYTLAGTWTLMAMVKTLTDTGKRLATVHMAAGETLVVDCVNA